jgi:lipoyl synthase
VRQIRELSSGTKVELLTPISTRFRTFSREVFDSGPNVLAHNLEPFHGSSSEFRPALHYKRSLDVVTAAREHGLVSKSNLILGMGETPDEVTAALHDLYRAGCEIVTITRYRRPTPRHHPGERWVKPEEFVEHSRTATKIGFAGVMAGQLVR